MFAHREPQNSTWWTWREGLPSDFTSGRQVLRIRSGQPMAARYISAPNHQEAFGRRQRKAVRLTGPEGDQFAPQEAADKSRVFFAKYKGGHGQAWSVSVAGGDERPVTGMAADVGWVPARSGIYFVNGDPRHYSLNYFDFVTQRVHKISDLPGLFVIWSISLSPDGRTLLFSGIEHSEGDIVLVEGFQ